MPSTLFIAVSTLFATLVAGQASTTISPSMPPTATAGFNIAPIPQQQRFQWCLAQTNNCPRICGGTSQTNSCEQSDLTYSCVCSNGTVPDVSAYRDTLPFYICQQTFVQCIAANPDDAQGQDTCKNNQRCGTLNATEVGDSSSDASASSTSATSMATSATATAASGSSAAASPTNAAYSVSQQAVTGAFAAIFLAVFRLLL